MLRQMRLPILLALTLTACAQQPVNWVSATIDGRSTNSFALVTRGGEIIGGHDGCNAWGLSDQPGLITMDAQECPPDTMRDVYWRLARAKEATRNREGHMLVVRAGQHAGIFVRR
jgi:hypothetical protein